MKRYLFIILLVCVWMSLLYGQESGNIRGIIKDSQTGEPLVGVNVTIKGTYKGASTDMDGFFLISDISPGEYTLEASYIGYKVVQRTGVKVEAGETVTINFDMTPTALALGQEIEVIGERPLLDIDETSTVRSVSSEDIENLIVNNALELVTQQVGIVEQDKEIHIRGGRSYEAQYLVDGISVQDPLAGTGFGMSISSNAIQEAEVITGGYKAEYGQATSGIVKVETKSGGEHYEGFISHKSDNVGLFRNEDFSFNTDQYEFNLGGPVPIFNSVLPQIGLDVLGKLYFFANFQSYLTDNYTEATANQLHSSISPQIHLFGNQLTNPTTFAPRQNNNWSGLFKLTWKLNPTNTFTYSYNRSLSISQNTRALQITLEYVEPDPGFPYDFSKNLDNFNTYTHDNEQIYLAWQHTLNKTTFFELKAARYYTHLRSDWKGRNWRDYRHAIDVARLPVEYFQPRGDSSRIRIIPGDGFYDYGNAFLWHDHFVNRYTFKGDLTSHFGEVHTVKGGFRSTFSEMQLIEIADPWVGEYGSGQDIYRVYPAEGAFYIQDDVRFRGFILNAGVRLDYWMPGKLADRAVDETRSIVNEALKKKYQEDTYKLFDHRFKLRLMPRLGVSFPISNNQMLYFNYGHFSKLPRPQFVYAKLTPTSAKSAFQKYGNPDLNPETSVKYELGIRHQFTQNDVLSITAFYKDIFDYIQTIGGTFKIKEAQRPLQVSTYVNRDYARSKGIEIEYKTRIGRYISGNLQGSLSSTTTKSSNTNAAILIAQQRLQEQPIKEVPARWDRPWQVSANLSINIPRDEHPNIFGLKLFSDWSTSVRFFAQAGKRYTPYYRFGTAPDGRPLYSPVEEQALEYSEIGPAWHWVDLNVTKYFRFFGLDYAMYLEVKNLFDSDNAQIINPVTGRAYEYGDPVPSSWNDPLYPDRDFPISSPYPFNPARYRAPRQILFGMSLEF